MNPLSLISRISRHRLSSVLTVMTACAFFTLTATPSIPVAYDIERAKEICDSIPAMPVEGIWKYPADNVTVLVARADEMSPTQLPEFDIFVIETTDCRLKPGDKIGQLSATAEPDKFSLSLFTVRKAGIFSHPETCIAIFGKNKDTLILKKKKTGLRLRLSSNLSSLLPKTLRIIRISTSAGKDNSNAEPPAGMVKIYPSYDGNGSSRLTPRYL